MIFVGNGSLLKQAITNSLKSNHKIDYIFSQSDELKQFCLMNDLHFKKTENINLEQLLFLNNSTDGIVLSINNGMIFKQDLLSLENFRFYNVHNGLIPKYRGLPEICIIYAILNGEKEYGVSLHQIDIGIDTGKCFKQLKFPIKDHFTFQDVMLRGLTFCDKILNEAIDNIITDNLKELKIDNSDSQLYTYKSLNNLNNFKQNNNFYKAINLGVFKLYFKKAYSIIDSFEMK